MYTYFHVTYIVQRKNDNMNVMRILYIIYNINNMMRAIPVEQNNMYIYLGIYGYIAISDEAEKSLITINNT